MVEVTWETDPQGFLIKKVVGDKLIGIVPLLFARARITVGPAHEMCFDDVY